ncbi:hypothetical protein GCM10023187_54280 [Nibrella viscosa]|uniref:Uncharacterized protein n=1 Tax=Nibrella viscosa TaxID=1084524 RepID=A0ABP8L0F9_9BACT
MAALQRIPVFLLMLLPVAVVGVAVAYYAVNFPFRDDYALQDQLLRFRPQDSPAHAFRYLAYPHQGQLIVLTRLVFLVCLIVGGTLNYYALALIGFGFLVGILVILYIAFRRAGLPPVYFIPVPFWLFSLQSYETLLWPTAAIQTYSQMVLVLITFYLLARAGRQIRLVALVPAVLALFSGSSGLVALIACMLVLFRQRHWRSAAIWAVTLILCLGVYPSTSALPPVNMPAPAVSLSARIESFLYTVGSFADLTAGLPGRDHQQGLSVGMGIVLVMGCGYFLVRLVINAFRRQNLPFWDDFFLASSLFLLMLALTSIPVSPGAPAIGLPGQNRLTSALLVSVVYLYSVYRWRFYAFRRWEAISVTLSTVVLSLLSSYWSLEGIVYQHRQTLVSYVNWLQNTPAGQQQVIRTIHDPSATPFFQQIARLTGPAALTVDAGTRLDSLREEPDQYVFVQEGTASPTPTHPDNGTYILLTSPDRQYLFAAWPAKPVRVPASPEAPRSTPNLFYAQIPKENLRPGRYRIGFLTNEPANARLNMTNQYILFSPADQPPNGQSAQPVAVQ